jgi:hypothetical protein
MCLTKGEGATDFLDNDELTPLVNNKELIDMMRTFLSSLAIVVCTIDSFTGSKNFPVDKGCGSGRSAIGSS